jgi:hypothetical protein
MGWALVSPVAEYLYGVQIAVFCGGLFDFDLCRQRELTRDEIGVGIPARSDTWKKTRHVVQTDAAPPNQGRICFAMTG